MAEIASMRLLRSGASHPPRNPSHAFIPSKAQLLVRAALLALGMTLFATGLFQLPSPSPAGRWSADPFAHPTLRCADDEPDCMNWDGGDRPAAFDRMVFVVIDALRADFMLPYRRLPQAGEPTDHAGSSSDASSARWEPGRANHARFRQLIQSSNRSLPFVAHAQTPTVTLPRIKALTTGSIPGFLDLAFNFGGSLSTSNGLEQQATMPTLESAKLLPPLPASWVDALVEAGRKAYFFGDDTWLRLYPRHFRLHDGTTSFVVHDFVEVDQNVTRHIVPAVLGLYDTGHSSLDAHNIQRNTQVPASASAFSDDGWRCIVLHFLGVDHICHAEGPSSPTLGPKLDEIDDMLFDLHQLLLGEDARQNTRTLLVVCGDHGTNERGNHGGSSSLETETAAIFLGSGLQANQGNLEEAARWRGVSFTNDQRQHIRQIDIAATVSLAVGLPVPSGNVGVLIESVLLGGQYSDRELCFTSDLRPRLRRLIRGQISILRQLYVSLGRTAKDIDLALQNEDWNSDCSTHFSNSTSLLDSARRELYGIPTQDDLLSLKSCECTLQALRFLARDASDALAAESRQSNLPNLAMACLTISVVALASIRSISSAPLLWKVIAALPVLAVLAECFPELSVQQIAAFSFHASLWVPASLFAAAVVFERLAFVVPPADPFPADQGWIRSCASHLLAAHALSLFSSSFIEEEHQTWYWLAGILLVLLGRSNSRISIVRLAFAMALLKIGRSINQTGVKWLQVPDLASELHNPQNWPVLLCSQVVAGLLLVTVMWRLLNLRGISTRLHHLSHWVTTVGIFGLILIQAFAPQHVSGTIHKLRLLACVKSVGLVLGSLLLPARAQSTSSPNKCAILYEISAEFLTHMLVLHQRPANLIVIACFLALLLALHQVKDSMTRCIGHVVLGYAFYYACGNSNAIGTLDVARSSIGFDTDSLVGPGLALFASTFGPMMISVLLALASARSTDSRRSTIHCVMVFHALHVCASVTSVLLQRHHLFIWSVFAPKVVYVVALSVAHLVLVVVHLVVDSCHD
ncbi:GPI7 protein [Capsaspora owczarzaki ATCC 30864]|uniref:GPI7 protein n=1 Tax=Capsaspora owczarzaki (strain ATCC 30864) TaxID=595528 RepID=A0A0D2WSC2_CAPO3|nr:GPI7 protein [Capsaspora owczarzaki ATCC 30864]KJE94318.1 GPI7 protein [Capsaspora owczarzaki ATCC 30864]|eukprot:XP_004346662.1 GPI7 protein [Capsaspora owczarzaki ATCC 30864]